MWALDLQQPAIIHQVSWWPQSSPQEIVKSAVEQQRQIIIEWIKQNLLRLWYSQEKINTFRFEVIWDTWIIINSKWLLNSWYKYSKENWAEFYTTFPDLQKSRSIKFALRETWYELKDWKLFIWGKEIPQFLQNWSVNPNFVRWIDNINFYDEINETFWLMKSVIKWDTIVFDYEWMYQSIVSWVMRIKDVMYFAWKRSLVSVDEKWTKLTDEEIKKLLKRAIEELPNQCSDTRFVKNARWVEMWMEVTKQELDEYLHPTEWVPFITQKMYDECLKRIQVRDRKIQEEQKLREWTRWEVKFEKARKSFSDRAMDILKWFF